MGALIEAWANWSFRHHPRVRCFDTLEDARQCTCCHGRGRAAALSEINVGPGSAYSAVASHTRELPHVAVAID
jgi:hypothetical protein